MDLSNDFSVPEPELLLSPFIAISNEIGRSDLLPCFQPSLVLSRSYLLDFVFPFVLEDVDDEEGRLLEEDFPREDERRVFSRL